MATVKVGRNDPCPCGSGKKYKQCHAPIDRDQEDHVRLLRRAQDRLFPKLIEATQSEALLPTVGPALGLYWDSKYTLAEMSELDDHEDHGSDRFLTWLAFDVRAEDGSTLVERIAAAPPEDLELDQFELEILPGWTSTRLRPYLITEVIKGKGVKVRDLLSAAEYTLRDHAAAKRLEQDELIFAHLVPVAAEHYIAGAAAHTTADTQEKLIEFLALYQEEWSLQHPEGTSDDFVRENSHLFNHFVLALPREENPSRVDDLMLRGRVTLAMTKAALGLGPAPSDDAQDADYDDEDEDDEDGDYEDFDDPDDEEEDDEDDEEEDTEQSDEPAKS
ncbi:MAG: SEC-C domain-containing protein [Herpetosiphonaceae bacterium]|nr:SEC-C domain-containing protein [Herpetosiphonaceae bacterium]